MFSLCLKGLGNHGEKGLKNRNLVLTKQKDMVWTHRQYRILFRVSWASNELNSKIEILVCAGTLTIRIQVCFVGGVTLIPNAAPRTKFCPDLIIQRKLPWCYACTCRSTATTASAWNIISPAELQRHGWQAKYQDPQWTFQTRSWVSDLLLDRGLLGIDLLNTGLI